MKKITKVLLIPQIISNFFLTSALFANNAITGWIEEVDEGIGSDLGDWLPRLLTFGIAIAALVCVAVLIGSGYMYITSAGDEEKVRKAGKSITYAIIGLIVCFIAALLVEFVLVEILSVGGGGNNTNVTGSSCTTEGACRNAPGGANRCLGGYWRFTPGDSCN